MRTVGELMTAGPATVYPDAPLEDCASLMNLRGLRHLPVVDGRGVAIGLLTDEALKLGLRSRGSSLPVGEAMERIDLAFGPDKDAIHGLYRLLHSPQDAIVVIDDRHRPLGLLTEIDAVALADVALRPWMKVSEVAVMEGLLYAVAPDATCGEALDVMDEQRIRHMLIAEDGKVTGVIARRDAVGRDRQEVRAVKRDVTWSAREDTPLHTALRLMMREGVGCLPLLTPEREPLGVMTRSDVIRALVRQLVAATKRPGPARKGRTRPVVQRPPEPIVA